MLKLGDIQKQHVTVDKTVKIEAWGGEVKICQLTVAQGARVIEVQKSEGGIASMVQTASFVLVEPAMTVEEINALSQKSFDGIREIVDAVSELEKPKK